MYIFKTMQFRAKHNDNIMVFDIFDIYMFPLKIYHKTESNQVLSLRCKNQQLENLE